MASRFQATLIGTHDPFRDPWPFSHAPNATTTSPRWTWLCLLVSMILDKEFWKLTTAISAIWLRKKLTWCNHSSISTGTKIHSYKIFIIFKIVFFKIHFVQFSLISFNLSIKFYIGFSKIHSYKTNIRLNFLRFIFLIKMLQTKWLYSFVKLVSASVITSWS